MATFRERVKKDGTKVINVLVRQVGYPTRTGTFPNKRMAQRWAKTIEASMIEGRHFRHVSSRSKTLAEAIERYTLERIPHLKSDGNMHRAALKWWGAKLGQLKLSDLTQSKISEYQIILAREPYTRAKPDSKRSVVKDGKPNTFLRTKATVNRYVSVLGSLLTATRRWEWMSSRPVENVSKFPENPDRARVLNAKERKALLRANRADKTLNLFVTVAISTVCRAGELVDLKWKDVDVEAGQLLFRDPKNTEPRSAWLTGQSKRLMAAHAKAPHELTDPVFRNSSGRGASYQYDDLFKAACEVAGIGECVFHNLRHTGATMLANDGASTEQIKAVGGWKSNIVSKYVHLAAKDTRAIVSAMNKKIV